MVAGPSILRFSGGDVVAATALLAGALAASVFGRIGLTDARAANAVWISAGSLHVFHRVGAGDPLNNGPVRVEAQRQPAAWRLEGPSWWVEEVSPRVLASAPGGGNEVIRLHRGTLPLWMPLAAVMLPRATRPPYRARASRAACKPAEFVGS
ncbi:MAG: hypothetical protein IT436_17645 [Phycisphaerales bacterium]|nr:hypothetical protein [Phycisphaerales bacterium]